MKISFFHTIHIPGITIGFSVQFFTQHRNYTKNVRMPRSLVQTIFSSICQKVKLISINTTVNQASMVTFSQGDIYQDEKKKLCNFLSSAVL